MLNFEYIFGQVWIFVQMVLLVVISTLSVFFTGIIFSVSVKLVLLGMVQIVKVIRIISLQIVIVKQDYQFCRESFYESFLFNRMLR